MNNSSHKGERFLPQVLSQDEVNAMISICNPDSLSGARNRAIVAVLYRCGLRVSEALALKTSDLDFDSGIVRVLHGKGDKARTVGIDDAASEMVQHYLTEHRHKVDDGPRVFVTYTGRPVLPRYVHTMMVRLARWAGISKRVHPHGLRHTHAHELEMEGVPVSVIAKTLGHASIHTTNTYLNHIHPTAAVNAIRGRRWTTQGAAQ
tara:strand:- start:4238 stop:4852 length:615 start_codon:yes stop_codon:yes gene_type:complete